MPGILLIILPRSIQKAPEHPDYRRYKDRNRIEGMFASRYDKTIPSFERFLNLAAARL